MAVRMSKDKDDKAKDESKKIEELKATEQGKAGSDDPNASDDTKEGAENKEETKEQEEQQKPPEQKVTTQEEIGGAKVVAGTVVCEYIGGGIWEDAKREKWKSGEDFESIKSSRNYPAQEYEDREDLKFMVGYGSMKIKVVE